MPTAPNTRRSRISNKLNGRAGKTVPCEEMAKYGWDMIDRNENSEYDILLLDECIIGYGGITTIQHFSKLENGIVTAKMDAYEVVQHTEIYAYHNPGYNTPVKYFVRAS